jgi:NlpC/P60 family putative phage cell wall peptidase
VPQEGLEPPHPKITDFESAASTIPPLGHTKESVYSMDTIGVKLDRCAVVLEARRWLGTPFHLQAKVRGAGCDCLGLLEGVWEAAVGRALPPLAPFYSADWRRLPAYTARFRARLEAFASPLPDGQTARPGDIVVFGLDAERWLHGGILSREGMFIHALADGAGAVCETRLDAPPWAGRLLSCYRYNPNS